MATKRENLLRTLRREGYEAVPLDLTLCPSQIEHFKSLFGNDDYLSWFGTPIRQIWFDMKPGFKDGRNLYKKEPLPENTRIDEWGVAHSQGSESAQHMTRMHHPLKGEIDLAELKGYPFPAINKESVKKLSEDVARLQQSELAVAGGMECTIWETSWYIRSMDDLMVDMMSNDDKAGYLLDRVTEIACKKAREFASIGVDILQLGDDIGMQNSIMMSLNLWRKWIKPRLIEVIRSAKSVKPDILVFYHSCGYVLPFLEDLMEAGVEILNPVQPESMPFKNVLEMTKGRISYWGTIGTQTTMPFGTPEGVRKAVRENIKACGKSGGIVIGPTHLVEPEVPWENLVALKQAVEEFQNN